MATTATVATVGIGLIGAPLAGADDGAAPTTTTIGQQAEVINGDVIQGWTITGLKPRSDEIPYTPRGTLWEATATNEAIRGSVQPVVSNLNASAADGEDYRVLFGVATPQGVNPAPLAQGEKTTGKVYFDVTGASPDTVVYNAGGHDLLVWELAPPAPAATGGSGGSGVGTPPAIGGNQSAPAQTTPAPATGSAGTPITEAAPGTPAPEAGGVGTPAAPAAVAPAPAAGGAGTPAPADGSAGTPVDESTTTSVVPHGSQYATAS